MDNNMDQEQINLMFGYAEMDRIRSNEAMSILRKERDRLLKETDSITLSSYSKGIPVPDEWATYQQELRDLPQVYTPEICSFSDDNPLGITSVTWPTKPS